MNARSTLAGLALPLALVGTTGWVAYDGVAPTVKPLRVRPLAPGRPGELVVVPGHSRAFRRGDGLRFSVEIEGGLHVDPAAVAARVTAILSDPRSWRVAVRRVSSGAVDFRVILARPTTTDRLCAPLATNGLFSCAQSDRAVLNAARWLGGAKPYRRALRRYRVYMVNHEVGHMLGHGHGGCSGTGLPAPVMMQQTKGLGGCRPNPWPLAWERG
jgi:hypothetical protein